MSCLVAEVCQRALIKNSDKGPRFPSHRTALSSTVVFSMRYILCLVMQV